MGHVRLLDEIGFDIASAVAATLEEKLGDRVKPSRLVKEWNKSGFLGRKNGKGFFINMMKRAKKLNLVQAF